MGVRGVFFVFCFCFCFFFFFRYCLVYIICKCYGIVSAISLFSSYGIFPSLNLPCLRKPFQPYKSLVVLLTWSFQIQYLGIFLEELKSIIVFFTSYIKSYNNGYNVVNFYFPFKLYQKKVYTSFPKKEL